MRRRPTRRPVRRRGREGRPHPGRHARGVRRVRGVLPAGVRRPAARRARQPRRLPRPGRLRRRRADRARPASAIALIDTVGAEPGRRHAVDDDQIDWLDALAATATDPVVVMGHHPQCARRRRRRPRLLADAERERGARRAVRPSPGDRRLHRRAHPSPPGARAGGGVPSIEVGCVKDFPGTWAEYQVYDGGDPADRPPHLVAARRWRGASSAAVLYADFGVDYTGYAPRSPRGPLPGDPLPLTPIRSICTSVLGADLHQNRCGTRCDGGGVEPGIPDAVTPPCHALGMDVIVIVAIVAVVLLAVAASRWPWRASAQAFLRRRRRRAHRAPGRRPRRRRHRGAAAGRRAQPQPAGRRGDPPAGGGRRPPRRHRRSLDDVRSEIRIELDRLGELVAKMGETSAQRFGQVDASLRIARRGGGDARPTPPPVAARGAGQPAGPWPVGRADGRGRAAPRRLHRERQLPQAGAARAAPAATGRAPRLHVRPAQGSRPLHGRQVPAGVVPALPRRPTPTPSAPSTSRRSCATCATGSRSWPGATTSEGDQVVGRLRAAVPAQRAAHRVHPPARPGAARRRPRPAGRDVLAAHAVRLPRRDPPGVRQLHGRADAATRSSPSSARSTRSGGATSIPPTR